MRCLIRMSRGVIRARRTVYWVDSPQISREWRGGCRSPRCWRIGVGTGAVCACWARDNIGAHLLFWAVKALVAGKARI